MGEDRLNADWKAHLEIRYMIQHKIINTEEDYNTNRFRYFGQYHFCGKAL